MPEARKKQLQTSVEAVTALCVYLLSIASEKRIRSGSINSKNEVINEGIKSTLNTNEQAVLKLIAAAPEITKPEMKEKTGLSMSTVERTIKSLKGKGIIERVGSNKTGYWRII